MSFARQSLILLAVSISLQGVGMAQGANMQTAVTAYNNAISGDNTNAIEAAIKMFDDILTSNPEEHLALIYKGSLTAKLAKVSWMPWNKLRFVNQGIDLMDKGVEALQAKKADARTEIVARMVRGITSARIPSAFKRGKTASADFQFIRQHPSFASMESAHRATALAYSAVLLWREGNEPEAQKYLAQARTIDRSIADGIWNEK